MTDFCERGSLRRTQPEDFAAVRALFDDPAFAEWGAGLSDEEFRAKFLGYRYPAVECFLVELSDEPIGFGQLHIADDGGEGGGLDLVLLAKARGRGLGTSVVRRLVRIAREERGWRRLTVDPDVSNEPGFRFWQRVGFVPDRIVSDDPRRQAHWIMTWPEHQ